jgi:prevent-host-death family protein
MLEVGAFEAKNRLGQLLDLVEQGEVVVITRHGKEVARLIPARQMRDREQARVAIRRIRERAEQLKLGAFNWSEWKSYRDEGRPVSLVLDSSATLAWIYSDETTEPIRRIFQVVADDGAVVPALWRLEIANSLTVATRRGRIDADFRHAALSDLALLDITTDDATVSTPGAKR